MKKGNLLKANEVFKLHTKPKQLPMLATSDIAEVLDNNEKSDKKAAEMCAKNLKNLFLKMKNEDPLKNEFNIYQNQEGREAIQEFLKLAKDPSDRARLFNYLEIKLRNLGLKGSRPSYSYFSGEYGNGAWYSIKSLNQDKIKEREINNRSEKCAKNLINLYKEFKLKNEDKEEMRMNILSQGWNNIEEFLKGTSGRDITEMFGYLSKELDARGYSFSRPSYTYFEGEDKGSAWISISEKPYIEKKAA